MKENYVKPKLLLESFTLSQTIAESCGASHDSTLGEPTHYDATTCEWDVGGFTLFFEHCDLNMEDFNNNYETLCYGNPNGGQTVFSSL